MTVDLLDHKSNLFTQNGEDGIIAAIFNAIGTETRSCCEFGAWDGVHFSNCRRLILDGWSGVMIEGDPERYRALVGNYQSYPSVHCVNAYVDVSAHSLHAILGRCGLRDLDLLSVDIDGLDFEILAALEIRPRVICIEVNAGHSPENEALLPPETARNNVGQSLKVFTQAAAEKGYDLVCYNGNAFFVRREVRRSSSLRALSSEEAYRSFLAHLSATEREWLYLVNLGLVPPFYRYDNHYLRRAELGIPLCRAARLVCKAAYEKKKAALLS